MAVLEALLPQVLVRRLAHERLVAKPEGWRAFFCTRAHARPGGMSSVVGSAGALSGRRAPAGCSATG